MKEKFISHPGGVHIHLVTELEISVHIVDFGEGNHNEVNED